MNSSNNFFQQVAELQKNIDWLNQILKGSEIDEVEIDGVLKPSISKDIKDRYAEIQAMVQGRAAYETKADLPSTPPEGVFLAEVWNDPTNENNGLYGWTGSEWQVSPYDVKVMINTVDKKFGTLSLQDQDGNLSDETGRQFAYAIVDSAGRVALAIDELGNLVFGLSEHESYSEVKGMVYGITDEEGRIAFGIKDNGGVVVGESDVDHDFSGEFAWAIVDSLGRVSLGVRHDGTVFYNEDKGDEDDKSPSVFHTADLMQTFSYGQSLSIGAGATPILNDVQSYSNVTFLGGVKSQSSQDYDLTDFKPLMEQESETPVSGMTNAVSKRLGSEYSDNQYSFIGSAPGMGGQRIDQLSRGTTPYFWLLEHVQAAHDICQLQKKSHTVPFIGWTQGEADMRDGSTKMSYLQQFNQLITDLHQDISNITNQSFAPVIVTYQPASHLNYGRTVPNMALAFLESHRSNNSILACPVYQFDYTDNVHLTNHCSEWLGEYYGKAIHKSLFTTDEWHPLSPQSVFCSGRVIDVAFHVPTPPLVLDTTWVTETHNFGFDVFDEDENLADIIESVTLIGPCRIRVILTREAKMGEKLTYAYGRETDSLKSGRVAGARGNLRDSEGEVDKYTDADGNERRMDNWCVIFEEQLV